MSGDLSRLDLMDGLGRDRPGELGTVEPEWDEAVDEVPSPFAPKPATSHVGNDSEWDQAITLAMQVARTNALVDAEKAVRDRIARTNFASEAKTLRLAADEIRKLRA